MQQNQRFIYPRRPIGRMVIHERVCQAHGTFPRSRDTDSGLTSRLFISSSVIPIMHALVALLRRFYARLARSMEPSSRTVPPRLNPAPCVSAGFICMSHVLTISCRLPNDAGHLKCTYDVIRNQTQQVML